MGRGFLILLSFFTRIPLANKIEYNEDSFRKALKLYPILGLIIGILLIPIFYLGEIIQLPLLKGCLLVTFYILITGGLHFDGLTDTADGIFSGKEGSKLFEIMSDSRIGAFGAITLVICILFYFVTLSYSDMWTCIIFPLIGRVSVIIGCSFCTYPKEEKGMGTIFVNSIKIKHCLISIIFVFILCFLSPIKKVAFLASFTTLILSSLVTYSIKKKIGGMTGDTCGFVLEVSQIIFLVLMLFFSRLI